MNSADPFDLVKDKVREKLASIKVLQEMYIDPTSQEQWRGIETELQSNIKSVDLFLGDLQSTIDIVEKNPQRFKNISKEEIGKRKLFISTTSQQMRQIEQQIKTRKQKQQQQKKETLLTNDEDEQPIQPKPTGKGSSKYSRLEESYIQDNQKFIDQQLQVQDQVKKNQDQQLDKMATTVQRVGQIAQDMGDELDEQHRELEDMEQHVDKTKGLLERTNKRLSNMLNNTSDKWKIIIIVTLIVVICILFGLLFIPIKFN